MALLSKPESTPNECELPNSTFRYCYISGPGGEATEENYCDEKSPTFSTGMFHAPNSALEDTGSFSSSGSPLEVATHTPPCTDSHTNLVEDTWRIYPSMWQSRAGVRCTVYQQPNPVKIDRVLSDSETTSPSVTDSLEDVSPCSADSLTIGQMIQCPSDANEWCKKYQRKGLTNPSTIMLYEPQKDEVSLPDNLSNIKNFDLKSSSSSEQISKSHITEQKIEFQGLSSAQNNKLLSGETTDKCVIPLELSSCISQQWQTQHTSHMHVKQSALPSDLWSRCRREEQSPHEYVDDEEKDENINSENHAVKNNNGNHHRLLQIRKNCTKVSEFCDGNPVALHMHPQDMEEKDRCHPKEEHQIPAVKEIKSGEEQTSGVTYTDAQGTKKGVKNPSKKSGNESVPVNTLTLRKAYDEKQRSETRKRIKDRKQKRVEGRNERIGVIEQHRRMRDENLVQQSQIVSTEKAINYRVNKQVLTNKCLKENIAIYNGPGRILIVKLESEACQTTTIAGRACPSVENGDSPKSSTPRDKNYCDEYEDDFECDSTNDATIPSIEDDRSQLRNSCRSEQQSVNRNTCVRSGNSYAEIARRLKSNSVSSRNSRLARSVCNSGRTTTSSELLPISATEIGPCGANGAEPEDRFVRFPPIELNNFDSRRFPRNAFSQGKIGLFRDQAVNNHIGELFRRRSEQLHAKPPVYIRNGRTQKFPALKRHAEYYGKVPRGRARSLSRDKKSIRRYIKY